MQVGVLSFRHECLFQVVGLHLDLCRVTRRVRPFADPLIFFHTPDIDFDFKQLGLCAYIDISYSSV